MNDLWSKLAGIMRFQGFTIEGDAGAGGGGGGAAAGGGTSAGAGDGGGGSTASPAAGAAPSTTPAAPISTQEIASSLTDDGGKPVRELGETSEAFLARFREHQKAHPATEEAVKTPEQIAEEARVKAAAAETPEQKLARERAAETPEQKAAREKAAAGAETPEQKAAREATEKAERERQAAVAQPGGEIYDLAPIPTETLAAAIKAHPVETEAFLKATGLTEDQLFANSRLAGRTSEYMQAGLPTLQSAKHAVAKARAFHAMDAAYSEIKKDDIQGTAKFLNDILLPMTYLRDDAGNLLKDEQGMPLTDGTTFTFMNNVYGMRNDFLARRIEAAGSEQMIGSIFSQEPGMTKLLDAVVAYGKKLGGDRGDMLQAAALTLKEAGKAGSSSGSDADLSPEVKARLAEADRVKAEAVTREQAIADERAAAFQTKVNTFKEEALGESSKEIDKIINNFLDTTSLKGEKFVREAVVLKIRAALYDNMSSDQLYLSQRDAITMGGPNAKTRKEWVALNVDEAKARLKTVSEPIFAEAGVKKLSKAEERSRQIEEQKKSSQMETRGGTSVSLPGSVAPKDDHELVQQAKENLRGRGEDVDAASVMREFRKLKTAPAA